jgi:hypothetical protein
MMTAMGYAETASDAPGLQYEQLSRTEQAAASLGVQPNTYQPIKFMNDKHHDFLQKENSLAPELSRRIAAYQTVSQASAQAGPGCVMP